MNTEQISEIILRINFKMKSFLNIFASNFLISYLISIKIC